MRMVRKEAVEQARATISVSKMPVHLPSPNWLLQIDLPIKCATYPEPVQHLPQALW